MGSKVQGVRGARAVSIALLAVAGMGAAQAQGAKKTATFDVTAVHVEPGAQLTSTSKVWVTPTQARADVKASGEEATTLISNGFIYQLHPSTKKGMKAPLPAESKGKDNFEAMLALLTFNASDALKQSKKTSTEKIAGYDCDVYVGTATKEQTTRTITIWIPQKMTPKIPLKVKKEDHTKVTRPDASIDQTVSDTITLSNLKVNAPIPAETFVVPKGYAIKSVSQVPQPGAPGGRLHGRQK